MNFSASDLPSILAEHLPTAAHEAEESTQTEHMHSAAVEESTFVDSVGMEEALEIYSRVRDAKPTTTLEIGMWTGASTLAILKALADNDQGQHYVCDPFQGTHARNAGLDNVRTAGLADRLHFAEAFPEDGASTWPVAEFAFVDGSHLFDLTILDFVLVDKHLAVDGIIGFHDMWMPALRRVIRWAVNNRCYVVLGTNPRPLTPRTRVLSLVAALLRRLPRADRIFSQDILQPWHQVDPAGTNMLFLRKTQEDNRDWREYHAF
jgi:predicted O-methyltransferase YrrM